MSTTKQRAIIMIPPVVVIIILIAIRSYGIWYDLPVKKCVQFLYLFCLGSIMTSTFYFAFIEGNVHISKSDDHDMRYYVEECPPHDYKPVDQAVGYDKCTKCHKVI